MKHKYKIGTAFMSSPLTAHIVVIKHYYLEAGTNIPVYFFDVYDTAGIKKTYFTSSHHSRMKKTYKYILGPFDKIDFES
jgi:hypothetical protein